jgi:hypothetical protein
LEGGIEPVSDRLTSVVAGDRLRLSILLGVGVETGWGGILVLAVIA